jgi:hypothetical protein
MADRVRKKNVKHVPLGFGSEDDWSGYGLENDPRFLRRIEATRGNVRSGRGIPLEALRVAPPQNRRPSRSEM